MSVATLEFYALPMARWIVLVAVSLEAYRVLLSGLRVYRSSGSWWKSFHEMRSQPFLVGLMLFYVNALVERPVGDTDRWGIVIANLLYGFYFLTRTAGYYGTNKRRKGDR